jgi:hypothetical protein
MHPFVFSSFSWGLILFLLSFAVFYFLYRTKADTNALHTRVLNKPGHTNRLILLFILGLTGAGITSCGSESDPGYTPPPVDPQCNSSNNGGWVTVTNPEYCPIQTESSSAFVAGKAFISDAWYRCCTGSATDTGVTVSWFNETSATSGYTVQFVRYCWFFGTFLCDHSYYANIPLAMGENRIIVTASDPSGVSGQRTITFRRVPETTPPTVTSSLPVDQSIDVAPNQQITASFSEEIVPATVNSNTFTLTDPSGNPVTGTVTYNAQTATFDPDTQLSYSTRYDATLTTAISDLSGNSLTAPYTWQFTTSAEPDTTPPTVNSTDPFDTETCVALNKDVSVTFNEAIDTSTINTSTFTLSDLSGNPVGGSITNTGTSAKFNPYVVFTYGTDYQATLTTGIKDVSSNALATDYNWTFSTVPNGVGTWETMSTTNAPSNSHSHSAIWSGTEMIVWGGINAGGRYNPATDTWQTTSTQNAPSDRSMHSAVWTGNEMIIWGGYEDYNVWLNSGSRYNPVTDSWQAVNLTGAPSERGQHVAVWTGSEMIIWGGRNTSGLQLNGARYNPGDDSWTSISTSNAPQTSFYVYEPKAIWTDQEMLVIDRISVKAHRYNPTTDTWQAMSSTGAPIYTSQVEAVTWTGTEMLVWGDGYFGAYDPVSDTWRQLPVLCTPSYRTQTTSVWTGNEMIIWGGRSGLAQTDTGGYYHQANNVWAQTTRVNAPVASDMHKAIWTGNKMIIWGGGYGDDPGGVYTP